MAILAKLTGTIESYFKLGISGPRLKNSSGKVAIRTSDDSTDAAVTVLDDAYAVGWNGNNEVPTKNAIYDKLELGIGDVSISTQTAGTRNETATKGFNIILCNCTSGTITINLPTAAGNKAIFNIKKTDSSANTVTNDPASTETIDGGSTAVLQVQYESITLISDNSNWIII